ncbi:MAG TPA: hypothetical protein DIU01_02085 [Flavobacterium sp.]|nr:hypothetical protein [Flavobacterium sp.]
MDLSSKMTSLTNEITKNFAFYIPYEIIDNGTVMENLEIVNFQITQEFVDEYVDRFLYFDDYFDIKKVEDYNPLRISNPKKVLSLQNNCFEIVQLKDSLGIESFNYFYNSYIERIRSFLAASELMISNYDELYPQSPRTPKAILIMQEAILKTHLIEVEEKIGIRTNDLDFASCVKNIILSENFNHFRKTKSTGVKQFREFITHKNKIEIENIIKTYYSDLKGVSLRYLMEFLTEKGVLTVKYGDGQPILDSLKVLFNNDNIGAYNSVFASKVFTAGDKNYKKAKINFEKTLNKIID